MTISTISTIEAVANKLKVTFPDAEIYIDEIEQGIIEPCFFIKVLNSSMDRELGRRYKRNLFIDIQYLSDKEGSNEDCHIVAEKLYEILDYVDDKGKLLRSTKKKHEVISGVLHFFLEFNYFLMREKENVPLMQKLESEVYKK